MAENETIDFCEHMIVFETLDFEGCTIKIYRLIGHCPSGQSMSIIV
jgi:hypothetical protein